MHFDILTRNMDKDSKSHSLGFDLIETIIMMMIRDIDNNKKMKYTLHLLTYDVLRGGKGKIYEKKR